MADRYSYVYGAFSVTPVPAQPQIAHCHGFFVVPEQRGQHFGMKLKEEQMKLLKQDHFDYATCTVDARNTPMRRILEKSGWKFLAAFANSRTGSRSELWGWAVHGETSQIDTDAMLEVKKLRGEIGVLANLLSQAEEVLNTMHGDTDDEERMLRDLQGQLLIGAGNARNRYLGGDSVPIRMARA
jgi:hypothetical protein